MCLQLEEIVEAPASLHSNERRAVGSPTKRICFLFKYSLNVYRIEDSMVAETHHLKNVFIELSCLLESKMPGVL